MVHNIGLSDPPLFMSNSFSPPPTQAPEPTPLLTLTAPVAMGYIPLGTVFGFLLVQAGEVFWAWGYPWLIGHAVHTVHVPSVFVLAFLLPLVSGALSQLVPVWAHPGRVTPARLACRALLARYGQCRALAHAAAGVSLAVGATIPALLFSAVALALFLGNVGRAWHAGVLGWAAWRN